MHATCGLERQGSALKMRIVRAGMGASELGKLNGHRVTNSLRMLTGKRARAIRAGSWPNARESRDAPAMSVASRNSAVTCSPMQSTVVDWVERTECYFSLGSCSWRRAGSCSSLRSATRMLQSTATRRQPARTSCFASRALWRIRRRRSAAKSATPNAAMAANCEQRVRWSTPNPAIGSRADMGPCRQGETCRRETLAGAATRRRRRRNEWRGWRRGLERSSAPAWPALTPSASTSTKLRRQRRQIARWSIWRTHRIKSVRSAREWLRMANVRRMPMFAWKRWPTTVCRLM